MCCNVNVCIYVYIWKKSLVIEVTVKKKEINWHKNKKY